MMELDEYVIELQKDIHSNACAQFIEEYKPFILSNVSSKLGRYVSDQNDEAFSVGLSAFLEAIEKYDVQKGHFYGFAKMVLQRRVANYLERHDTHIHEDIDDHEMCDNTPSLEEQIILKQEIEAFEKKLQLFGLTFDDLVENKPMHLDTRERSVEIGKKTSQEQDLVDWLYEKRRLPITKMCRRFNITRKIIGRSKEFIISVIVVWVEKFDLLKQWI